MSHVLLGSRWTTRGTISRKVTVISVRNGYATVAEENARGAVWTETVERIEREWTRRASLPAMKAVTLVGAGQ